MNRYTRRLGHWTSGGLVAVLGLVLAGCTGLATAGPAAPAPGQTSQPAAAHAAPHTTYPASLQPAPAGTTHKITLTIEEKVVSVAEGVRAKVWTFGGTVPGPALRVKQGDYIEFTLVNKGTLSHSMDFHAAQTPWDKNYKSILPGETLSYTWKAEYPGVFMYHCGSAPALLHISNGMYGAIIVDPAEPLPPAKEYVLVQSEFYLKQSAQAGVMEGDWSKMTAVQPDYVTFNGYAEQYKDAPLTANSGERVRIYVMNAGPNLFSAFHMVGAIFDKAYADGNPANVQRGMQTVTIPPGGGYVVELTVPNEGLYPIVTHAFAYPGKGALGLLKVGNPAATTGSH
ncbi:MAG: multicopper oxidase domain-containing protein [Dehalococcoidia bacterium]|nr:multicopper oxidase domain-containing protein [Dehalococcoidia bacterium]